MKVDQKGHTTIIKDTQNNIEAFVGKITNEYRVFQGQNLILDLSHDKAISNGDLVHFKELAKNHKKAKKSMIIVSDAVDFDKVPNYLNVVPSVLEAHDMIEMDEIERDLGF
ncbi:MAG: ribonuclease Z [Flavobacterium sp.]|uniref:ribonuclease Z n=1 Tax=Flavobacterium sp. TaxID=239 RepID=UPI00379D1AA6